MALCLCMILDIFIFFDIFNGAGKVPFFLMAMNSLFLALYCVATYAVFMLVIKQKIDKIQLFVLWMMAWQLSVAMLMQSETSLNMIYQIAGWPLLFVVIYQLTKKKVFVLPTLKYTSLLWISASAYVVYILRTQMFNDIYRIYYLIIAIPFFICLNEKWKYSRLVMISALVILSYKRTGFMALVIAFGMYFLCDISIQKGKSKKVQKVFFLFILSIISITVLYRYGDSMAVIRRLKRMISDNGSDRFVIWSTLMDHFETEEWIYKLVGNGYKSCYLIMNGEFAAAHNDFIEILLDYGLVGLVNHMIFIVLIGKNVINTIKIKAKEASGFTYMFCIWMILMLFSFMTWQSILMKPVAIYFAYMLAKYRYSKDDMMINGGKNVERCRR